MFRKSMIIGGEEDEIKEKFIWLYDGFDVDF